MKKGDFLLCNDGKTKVRIAGFDSDSISVIYKGKLHKRPRSCIGKTLHIMEECQVCGEIISSLFCEICDECGHLVCNTCGHCRPKSCKRYMTQKEYEDYEYCHSSYNLIEYDDSYSRDESDYDDDQFEDYDGGPEDNYNYYYNDDYDGDDYDDN